MSACPTCSSTVCERRFVVWHDTYPDLDVDKYDQCHDAWHIIEEHPGGET